MIHHGMIHLITLINYLKLPLLLQKDIAELAIQEIHTDEIITLYHPSLFAVHQGAIKNLSNNQ